MWNSIASVSSIFTLVAFLAAAVAWSYRRRLTQMERLAKLAPEDDRRQVVGMILDRVSVDTSNLTRQQRYDLALRLIENRSRRFKTLSVIVTIVAIVGAITAMLAIRTKWAEEKERSMTAFPAELPFNTGWIFVGYHDSFRWVEGPMVSILRPSEKGLTLLERSERSDRYGRPSIPDLGSNMQRSPGEKPHEEVQTGEDLIRLSRDSPSIGDILRVSKPRNVIVAKFKTEGLKNQMAMPGLIKTSIEPEDETGVVLPYGSLVIVRDVQAGAYPGRPAAVWCRIAACSPDIPQCKDAFETAKKAP